MTATITCAASSAARVTVEDRDAYYKGSYQAFASPWSTFFDASLKRGVDYRDQISIDPVTFPSGTIIDTRWPTRPLTASGVWGYHALLFGNYDGGRPPVPVRPRQASAIVQLDEEFVYNYSGSPNFNLLNEFYLTARAGDEKSKLIEIGYFLHWTSKTLAFAEAGTSLGIYKAPDGRAWTVHRQDKYVMLIPADRKDVVSGRLQIVPLLAWLRGSGQINGNEWFNGLGFGTEPTEGAGHTRLTIVRWNVALH